MPRGVKESGKANATAKVPARSGRLHHGTDIGNVLAVVSSGAGV